jgi:hypothetical protein
MKTAVGLSLTASIAAFQLTVYSDGPGTMQVRTMNVGMLIPASAFESCLLCYEYWTTMFWEEFNSPWFIVSLFV